MSTSLLALKAQTDAGSAEQKRLAEKKKSILLLINDYLNENGFIETAKKLSGETNGLMSKLCAADNVDLMLILNEYEAYYEMRFGRKPKFVRKLQDGEINPHAPRAPEVPPSNKKLSNKPTVSAGDKLPSIPANQQSQSNNAAPDDESNSLGVQGTSVSKSKRSDSESQDHFEER